jgi:hypothetical protein
MVCESRYLFHNNIIPKQIEKRNYFGGMDDRPFRQTVRMNKVTVS